MHMHKKLTLLATAAMLAALPAMAQTPQPTQATPGQTGMPNARSEVLSTQEFLRLAAMSDRFEVASSRIALEKTQNTHIREFASRMSLDHTKTTQQIQQLMQQSPTAAVSPGTPVPQGRDTVSGSDSGTVTNAQGGPQHQGLDEKHAKLLQELQDAKTPLEFDQIYLRQQVAAHQEAVDMFRNYSQSGDNQQVRQFAGNALPILGEHLDMVQQIQKTTAGRQG